MTVHVRVRVGAEHYAVPVDGVLEVVELGELAPVPGAPPSVLGLRNVRGQVLPVFDVARVFGIDRGTPTRIVVAEDRGRRVGLAVDGVTDVAELPEPAEDTESEFLRGASLVDDSLVGIVDLARVVDLLEASS